MWALPGGSVKPGHAHASKKFTLGKIFFSVYVPCFLISLKADAQKQKTDEIATVCVNKIKSDIKINVPDTIPVATLVQTAMQVQQSVHFFVGGVVAGTTILPYKNKTVTNSSEIICTKTSLKDRISALFGKFSVYPNPAVAGQTITIANKRLEDDQYDMEIINLYGQSLHTKQLQIKGKQKINIRTPFLPTGIYFLQLTGKKSSKMYSGKIIIQ